MPLEIPQILLVAAILLTAASGVWLMINANAVARLFSKGDAIVPGPGPRRASPAIICAMLLTFVLSASGSIAIYAWAMSDQAGHVIQSG